MHLRACLVSGVRPSCGSGCAFAAGRRESRASGHPSQKTRSPRRCERSPDQRVWLGVGQPLAKVHRDAALIYFIRVFPAAFEACAHCNNISDVATSRGHHAPWGSGSSIVMAKNKSALRMCRMGRALSLPCCHRLPCSWLGSPLVAGRWPPCLVVCVVLSAATMWKAAGAEWAEDRVSQGSAQWAFVGWAAARYCPGVASVARSDLADRHTERRIECST